MNQYKHWVQFIMKIITIIVLTFLTINFCTSQTIQEISGSYRLTKVYSIDEYLDTNRIYNCNDTSVLKDYCKRLFNNILQDSLFYKEMIVSEYNNLDSLFFSKQLTINADSTFALFNFLTR
jgi:hypothetical protein